MINTNFHKLFVMLTSDRSAIFIPSHIIGHLFSIFHFKCSLGKLHPKNSSEESKSSPIISCLPLQSLLKASPTSFILFAVPQSYQILGETEPCDDVVIIFLCLNKYPVLRRQLVFLHMLKISKQTKQNTTKQTKITTIFRSLEYTKATVLMPVSITVS